ncbi:MAG: prepilin-type N-terminal cleavage/methylation domain-containing protein [Firmicutes bacterium]|nr:prepilin-type N-terminal cleavage/methylation domain-containing protein [Bacillota bacterium]
MIISDEKPGRTAGGLFKPQAGKGYTLIEVLVACAVFLAFLAAVVSLFVQAIRSFRFGEARVQVISDARIGLDRISHDLKKAKFIIYPDESVLRTNGSGAVVFTSLEARSADGVSTNVFGYSWDDASQQIKFVLYSPEFDPETPSTQKVIQTRLTAGNIEYLNFKQDDTSNPQIITIRLRTTKIQDDQVFLLTKIFIRH